ncbi:MAG: GNAT family N-acetyltransferase [Thermomicrobiales bacterium]
MPAIPTITTDRLILRLAEPSDVPAVIRYFTDNAEHLAPTFPLAPPGFLTEEYWLRQVAQNHDNFAAGRTVKFFLFPRDEPGLVVGGLSLNNIVRGSAHSCDLGYSLAADRQGQGLMTEAVTAVIRYAFEDLGLHRVKAAYLPANERSGRLLRRLGFVVDGYARDYLYIQGRWQDQVLVGLVNPAWQARG